MPRNDDDKVITIAMVGDRRWRVYYGDQVGGRYVNVDYDDIRDHVTGRRPRAELIKLYKLDRG